jgi:hypothetical protein
MSHALGGDSGTPPRSRRPPEVDLGSASSGALARAESSPVALDGAAGDAGLLGDLADAEVTSLEGEVDEVAR